MFQLLVFLNVQGYVEKEILKMFLDFLASLVEESALMNM